MRYLISPIIALLLALSSTASADGLSPPSAEQILAEASQYTVKIEVQNEIALNQDEAGAASGTGFLIDRERGWVLTNAHVATRSPSLIKLSFKNGKDITARRVHVDALLDLAILSIPSASIPAEAKEAELSCDELPAPGTSVMAFGHPWGLSYTASRGIISGLSWFYPTQMIQTDAAINSGNSGGPLISLSDGRVVGINTSTYQPEGGDAGATAISLAEPIPAVCRIIELIKAGKDARLRVPPFAIAVSDDDLRPRIAKVFHAELGLQSGDIITAVNGTTKIENLTNLLNGLRHVGDEAAITIERGGQRFELTIPVRVIPDPLGVKAINLSGLIISEPWRIDDFEANPQHNLGVDWIEAGEEAELTDAQIFDQIVSIDGQEFRGLEALYEYLRRLPKDASVEVILKRASSSIKFYREHRHITLSMSKLEWVTVQ